MSNGDQPGQDAYDKLGPNRRHVHIVIEMNLNDIDLEGLRNMADKLVEECDELGLEPGEVDVKVEDGGLLGSEPTYSRDATCSKCGKPAVGRYPGNMEPRCRTHMPKGV